MKRSLLVVSIALLASSLVGCTVEEVPTVTITGDFTKKSYVFNDEWNTNGIKIMGTFKNGTTRELNKNEYTLTLSPAKPRGFTNKLSVKVLAKGSNLGVTKTISNITVANEVWDLNDEISTYYSDCNMNGKSGSSLLSELQKHSFRKHTHYVKYGEVVSYYKVTDDHRSVDEIPGENKNEMFYTGEKTAFVSASKEHVWACNDTNGLWVHNTNNGNQHYVDDPNYVGGGSDLFHVRPCNNDINTARGDASFTELVGGSSVGSPYALKCSGYTMDGGKITFSSFVEPADEFKGDFARIVAYVYMHYSTNVNGTSSSFKGNLNFNKIISTSGTQYGSATELLIAWNDLDPVSEVEKYRNHTVMGIQGNRNPFVDFSDLMEKCF